MWSEARWWMMLTIPLLALAVASSHAHGATGPLGRIVAATHVDQRASVVDVRSPVAAERGAQSRL
jgi:hypothetical protein